MAAALALCVAGVGFTDSITVDGVVYEDVYVRESASSYYVQIPSDGRVLTIAKDKVDSGDVSISGDAEHRQALLNEWKEKNAKHQEKRTTEQRTQAREATEKQKAAALELLDKYATTQDKLQSSFVIKSKTSEKRHIRYSDVPPYRRKSLSGKWQTDTVSEHRYDGERHKFIERRRGDVKLSRTESREDEYYNYHLWDGKAYIEFFDKDPRGHFRPYLFLIEGKCAIPAKRYFISKCPCGHMLGYFQERNERIDATLRESANLRVREETESVGGVECQVIEGDTHNGKYTIWLDPEHGYNMAKVRVERRPGDAPTTGEGKSSPFVPGSRQLITVDNTRFEKIGDAWVLMEAIKESRATWPDGDFSASKYHTERTAVVIDPDHEALRSFLPDEIPGDAGVKIPGKTYGPEGPPTWREWRERQAGGGE